MTVVVGRAFNAETDLYEALVAVESTGLHVVFPEPLTPHGERLMRTLGVTWSVDPNAPRLAEPVTSEQERPDGYMRPSRRKGVA